METRGTSNAMTSFEITSPVDFSTIPDELPLGVTAECVGGHAKLSISSEVLFTCVIGFASGIPASLVAAFLYDAIKKRSRKDPKHISIDKVRIEFHRGQISKFMSEHTESKD